MYKSIFLIFACFSLPLLASITQQEKQLSDYAVAQYHDKQIHTLANLVSYPTVNTEQFKTPHNPAFIGFKKLLKMKAAELGFDFQDHGYTVIIGMGQQSDTVTVVTHGDVQPANAKKWQQNPFTLDSRSEPGKLIARGTEDNKGPIATALYAMKAIKDHNIELNNRIELMVYLAEESDWQPLRTFLTTYPEPKYAVTIDASYPVVVAEKGWSLITTEFHNQAVTAFTPYVDEFQGGAFKSQIPEDASLMLYHADDALLTKLKQKANTLTPATFHFESHPNGTKIYSKGVSAHSSEPQHGVNALQYLAALFDDVTLQDNASSQVITFFNQLLKLDIEGQHFGNIAYRHDFMGAMTVAPTLLQSSHKKTTLSINLRRPVGKSEPVLRQQILAAIAQFEQTHQIKLASQKISLGEPMLLDGAPHANALLDIFRHFTGQKEAGFVSIGGGTNAKLFKNAVSFGPSMPGAKYTGHSEHEFITQAQLKLNLKMYTTMLLKLGNM